MVDSRVKLGVFPKPMSLLIDGVKSKKFDVRVIERGLQRGTLNAEEVQKHLASLPDDSESGELATWDDIIKQEVKKKR